MMGSSIYIFKVNCVEIKKKRPGMAHLKNIDVKLRGNYPRIKFAFRRCPLLGLEPLSVSSIFELEVASGHLISNKSLL